MRRVLIAQKFPSLGGSQVSLVHFLRHLDRTRFAPHVAVVRAGWLTARLDELGVPWTPVAFGQWNLPSLPRNYLLVRRLRRLLREQRIDLVHANEHWVGPPCLWAARAEGIPAVCHFRTGLEDATARRVRKYGYARFDRVLAVAGVLARELGRHLGDPGKVSVVRDGVEPPAGPPRYWERRSRRIAITVGAIRREKGQARVLEAALPWLEASPRHYLAFVGTRAHDAAYVAGMDAVVAAHGLARQVRFLGNRDDVPRLLRLADVLVAYSAIEGIPRVVTEALQAGRPVIVSRTPGMDEVVLDGEVGRIVDFDDPSGPVSRALLELSADPGAWVAMGRRAAGHARRFSTEAMTREIEAIYNAVLESRAKKT